MNCASLSPGIWDILGPLEPTDLERVTLTCLLLLLLSLDPFPKLAIDAELELDCE